MTTPRRPAPREDGRARVITALLRSGPLSRADLARRAGLAASTVTGLVAGLQDDGVVVEGARVTDVQGPGRPATLLALGRSSGLVAGLDIGKSHVTVGVADLAHEVLAERRADLGTDLTAAEQVRRAEALLDEALASVGSARAEVIGMAAGIAGPVHRRSGHLGDSTILPAWVDLAAEEVLASAFGRPVRVDNDANLGALAEWRHGAGRESDHVVYVKISTGVGAGLVLDGVPFSGFGGTAGEIGHLVIEPDGPACRCGRRGCLEAVTGSGLLVEHVRRTAAAGSDVTSVGDVVRRADQGDPVALEALRHCGTAVGTAVAMVCNLLNPEVVVIGGELAAAGEHLVVPLAEQLRRAALSSTASDVVVRPAELGERAELLGALTLALRSCAAGDLLG